MQIAHESDHQNFALSYSDHNVILQNQDANTSWQEWNLAWQSNSVSAASRSSSYNNVALSSAPSLTARRANDNIVVHPNPIGDHLFIPNLNIYEGASYQIFNLAGQVQKSGTLTIGEKILDITGLSSGSYVPNVEHRDSPQKIKFIEQ